MHRLALIAICLFTFADALVTFKYSTVIQASDLVGVNKLNFKCTNLCKVYADLKSENFTVSTLNGNVVTTFDAVVGASVFAPTGVVLQGGVDYYLENKGADSPDFVMYVVDSTAPNYGAPVYVPQDTVGVAVNGNARYVTILSSFDAMWFSGFTGQFPAGGYPRIYATPFDAVGPDCRPVYQARSQYNAEISWPTIATAVFTVDFGFVGTHTVSVNKGEIKEITKSNGMSTVYTSPGYVGCDSNKGQNYFSRLSQVQDTFTLQTDSLDVNAIYTGLATREPVTFTVANKLNNFVGTGTFTDHFDKGSIFVDLSWVRATSGSSFAIQMDFSNGGALLTLTTLVLVIATCLW